MKYGFSTRIGPRTIGEKLSFDRYRPTGFDLLRIALAILVLVSHSWTIALGEAAGLWAWSQPWIMPLRFVLPAFFALSGFLVSGSMERCKTLLHFLMLRGIRIYPALCVEVILSAFMIGPLVTSFSLNNYFSDRKFFIYLINIIGDIHYYLPGVFHDNPKPDVVNWQLWTVPWELICYACLSLLIVIGIKTRRWIIIPAVLLFLLTAIVRTLVLDHRFSLLIAHVGGYDLVLYFLLGVMFYIYRNYLPRHWLIALISLLISWISIEILPGGQYFAAIPLVYVTLYLGTCNPRLKIPFGIADSSYGVYLYGYVIQQLVARELPWSRTALLNLVISIPLATLAGLASWHLVESPVMRMARPRLGLIEAVWIEWLTRAQQARTLAKFSAKTPKTKVVKDEFL